MATETVQAVSVTIQRNPSTSIGKCTHNPDDEQGSRLAKRRTVSGGRSLPVEVLNGCRSAESWQEARKKRKTSRSVNSAHVKNSNHTSEDGPRIVVINMMYEPSKLRELFKCNTRIVYFEQSPKTLETQKSINNYVMKSVETFVKDLKRDIWILMDTIPKKESEVMQFVRILAEYRQESMKQADLPLSAFPIQIFLSSYNHKNGKLPRNNESVRYATFPYQSAQDLGDILERQYLNRKRKVGDLVGRPLTDAFCEVVIKLFRNDNHEVSEVINSNDLPYVQDSYKAVEEFLQDPNSTIRQQFHHWYKIPNVHVAAIQEESDEPSGGATMLMILELRPLQLQGFTLLSDQIRNAELSEAIRENLRVNRQEFLGWVRVEMKEKFKSTIKTFLLEIDGVGDTTALGNEARATQNSVLSLKGMIITALYNTHLDDPKKLPCDFLTVLKLQGLHVEQLCDHIRNSEGRNAMHMAISAGRVDFLRLLFFLNKWGELRRDVVNSTARKHVGFTPRRLAEAMAFTTKGQEVLEQFDKLESWYLNLPTLSKAALNGQLQLVKILVEADPDVIQESPESKHLPSLVCASGAGHKDIVEYLLRKHCAEKVPGHQSAIHAAIELGHADIVEIFAKYVVDLTGRHNEECLNAIDYCAMIGARETLRVFHEKKFPITANSLMPAVRYSRATTLDYLLDECKLNVNEALDKEGRRVLHQAAISGDLSILEKLLNSGAKLASLNKFGANVLHVAAEYNQATIAEIVLRRAKESGELPRIINIQDIFTGKDVYYLIRGRDRGRRAWHWLELRRMNLHLFKMALSQGQLDVADHGKVLYSGFGPGPDKDTNDKMQAKQDAALEPGNQKMDMTPLHYGACKEHPEVVKVLLQYGADPNVQDNFGATPGHHAAMRGNLPILVSLVESGAKLDLRTTLGKSILDVATENGHQEIMNYLESTPLMLISKIFLTEAVLKVRSELDADLLAKKRANGQDIRRHLIATLRELSIDINTFLLQLGSGPVLEATTD